MVGSPLAVRPVEGAGRSGTYPRRPRYGGGEGGAWDVMDRRAFAPPPAHTRRVRSILLGAKRLSSVFLSQKTAVISDGYGLSYTGAPGCPIRGEPGRTPWPSPPWLRKVLQIPCHTPSPGFLLHGPPPSPTVRPRCPQRTPAVTRRQPAVAGRSPARTPGRRVRARPGDTRARGVAGSVAFEPGRPLSIGGFPGSISSLSLGISHWPTEKPLSIALAPLSILASSTERCRVRIKRTEHLFDPA